MLTSEQILNNIDELVDRSYLNFTYRIVGEEFLTDEQKIKAESLGIITGDRPLMEILYIAARQRATTGYKQDQSLNDLLAEIGTTGVLPSLSEEERYTLTHSKAKVKKSIETARDALKTKTKDTVLQANLEFKEELASNPAASMPERAEIREKNSNKLLRNVTMAVVGAFAISAFRKEFTTSMTESVNSAIADEVRKKSGGSDPWVYKQIVDDSRTSPECRMLHTNDGSGANPKLYRLSELFKNGTNVGKPRSQWKAVLGPVHPNCRCTLKEATAKMIEDNKV